MRVLKGAVLIEHLREPHIVIHGRKQAAAARFETRRFGHLDQLHRQPAIRIGREGFGEALILFRTEVEVRVGHAERLENPLVQECAQRFA